MSHGARNFGGRGKVDQTVNSKDREVNKWCKQPVQPRRAHCLCPPLPPKTYNVHTAPALWSGVLTIVQDGSANIRSHWQWSGHHMGHNYGMFYEQEH